MHIALQDFWTSTDANTILCILKFWQNDWGEGYFYEYFLKTVFFFFLVKKKVVSPL